MEWLRLRSASAVWHAAGCVVIDTTRDVFKNFFRYPIDLLMLTSPLLKKLNQSVATGNTLIACELLVTSGFSPFVVTEETVCRVTKRIGNIATSLRELKGPCQ